MFQRIKIAHQYYCEVILNSVGLASQNANEQYIYHITPFLVVSEAVVASAYEDTTITLDSKDNVSVVAAPELYMTGSQVSSNSFSLSVKATPADAKPEVLVRFVPEYLEKAIILYQSPIAVAS